MRPHTRVSERAPDVDNAYLQVRLNLETRAQNDDCRTPHIEDRGRHFALRWDRLESRILRLDNDMIPCREGGIWKISVSWRKTERNNVGKLKRSSLDLKTKSVLVLADSRKDLSHSLQHLTKNCPDTTEWPEDAVSVSYRDCSSLGCAGLRSDKTNDLLHCSGM